MIDLGLAFQEVALVGKNQHQVEKDCKIEHNQLQVRLISDSTLHMHMEVLMLCVIGMMLKLILFWVMPCE